MAELDLGINLYEFNKQAMKNENPMDPILLNNRLKEIAKELRCNPDSYWMLLNNERKDYTVFHIKKENLILKWMTDALKSDLKETLQNRGQVLSVDKLEDDNYEIWIRDQITNENFVYYLFNYTNAVLEY